jgi:hypothetical protein
MIDIEPGDQQAIGRRLGRNQILQFGDVAAWRRYDDNRASIAFAIRQGA